MGWFGVNGDIGSFPVGLSFGSGLKVFCAWLLSGGSAKGLGFPRRGCGFYIWYFGTSFRSKWRPLATNTTIRYFNKISIIRNKGGFHTFSTLFLTILFIGFVRKLCPDFVKRVHTPLWVVLHYLPPFHFATLKVVFILIIILLIFLYKNNFKQLY